MQPSVTPPLSYSSGPVQSDCRCMHSRIVDEVRDANGMKTGRLVCLECFMEFPDLDHQTSRK